MTLARAWTRRVYGASFVALLVPGTVLGSLAVLAMAGGLGRLGAIGQVFSGPAVPSAPATGGGTGGGATSGAGRLPGPPAPTPRPSPPPTLTDRVVATARSVTSRVPGAAGQIATGAVNTVGSIADKLLPGNGNGNGTGSQALGAGAPLGGLP